MNFLEMHFQEIIKHYGYIAIYFLLAFGIVGLPVPEDLSLLFVGFLLSTGFFHPIPAYISGILGSLTGITVSYMLGRTLGFNIVTKYGKFVHLTPKMLERFDKFNNRFGRWLLVFAYFIPGVRHLSALSTGISKLEYKIFARFAYSGGVIWVCTFITLGTLLGEEWHKFHEPLKAHFLFIACVLVCIALCTTLYGFWLSSRRLHRVEGKERIFIANRKVPFIFKIYYRIQNIWNPDVFQGIGKTRNYFEGWYFKLVDKEQKNAYAVIAGVSLVKDPSKSHSFIQVLNGKTHESFYFKFNAEDFHYSPDYFEIRIKENIFAAEKIVLDLNDDKKQIKAEIEFSKLTGWPVNVFSPGIMGFYTFIPFMECYHAVLGLNHELKGTFNDDGESFDFSGGKGYIEKDRGLSLPESWIWIQSNNFNDRNASLTLSVAKVPWLGSFFGGLLAGFWYNGKLFKFTTYNGTKLSKLEVNENSVEIEMVSMHNILKVNAFKRGSGELFSPVKGDMKGRINESLDAVVNVLLLDKKGNVIFNGLGKNAGFETVGDHKLLLKGNL